MGWREGENRKDKSWLRSKLTSTDTQGMEQERSIARSACDFADDFLPSDEANIVIIFIP